MRIRTRALALVVALALAVALAGCSSGGTSGSGTSGGTTGGTSGGTTGGTGTSGGSTGGATGTTVIESGNTFSPATLSVSVGDTVTFTNEDAATHQVLIDGVTLDRQAKGESVTWTASKAGTYDYSCTIHPSMKGTIEVK